MARDQFRRARRSRSSTELGRLRGRPAGLRRRRPGRRTTGWRRRLSTGHGGSRPGDAGRRRIERGDALGHPGRGPASLEEFRKLDKRARQYRAEQPEPDGVRRDLHGEPRGGQRRGRARRDCRGPTRPPCAPPTIDGLRWRQLYAAAGAARLLAARRAAADADPRDGRRRPHRDARAHRDRAPGLARRVSRGAGRARAAAVDDDVRIWMR